ncbi:MAG TPA: carboxypeptidase regulatory-like domain-containing protein [Gemmatimonadaceae bacterium]|nr:carboxypeptidase regulatory-like domain-containing protein [Gemmatimonadaceae bacterium]
MTFPHLFEPAKLARRSAVIVAGLFLVAVGCHDDDGTGPEPRGTVAGAITSSLGGSIAGVKVTVTPTSGSAPAQVTTGSDGKFSIAGVPVSDGKGTLALAELPSNCTDPGGIAYTGLASGGTVSMDIELDCHVMVGTVSGTVTSSLGGPLSNVQVSVDPDGDAPAVSVATDADGKYSVGDVPVGAGSVSVSGIPDNCSVPTAATYEGLEDGGAETLDITVPCDATTGGLTVTVTGLVGFDGNIHVTGPNGFNTTLTNTSTLTGLEPGSYSVSGTSVVVDDPVVISRYVAATAGSPATVVAGETVSVAVTYAIRTGSGGLWFTNTGNSAISRFAAGQLHASGSPKDTTSIIGPGVAYFAAFDTTGDLWVSTSSSNALSAYTREQLVAGGTPTATRTISGVELSAPNGIAFDANGTMWVASAGNNSILAYSAAAVEDGGTPAPMVTITSTDLSTPTALAFDAAGNLWVANSVSGTVVEFSTAQLGSGGNLTPAVILSATGGSIASPTALAFDADGNLWVANNPAAGVDNIIVSFSPAQLASSGSPTPSVTISASGNPQPSGLAFDESGSLWVSLNASNSIVKYSADQLASSGTPTPALTISPAAGGTLSSPAALVFDPHAEGLPIR